jgi:hypothetical protein
MLITLDDMKDYLGIPLSDTSKDVFLESEIATISQAIEGYCGRIFEVGTYTQIYYFDEFEKLTKDLYLYHFPVKEITEVREGGEALEPAEYRVKKNHGILIKPRGFFRTGENVEVDYEAGFDEIPAPITSVVKSLVEERYNKRELGIGVNFGNDVQQISIPGTINVAFDYSLQANERKTAFGTILGNYVNVLDFYRSERAITGEIDGSGYVE